MHAFLACDYGFFLNVWFSFISKILLLLSVLSLMSPLIFVLFYIPISSLVHSPSSFMTLLLSPCLSSSVPPPLLLFLPLPLSPVLFSSPQILLLSKRQQSNSSLTSDFLPPLTKKWVNQTVNKVKHFLFFLWSLWGIYLLQLIDPNAPCLHCLWFKHLT